jgi:hypothetical protein
MKTNYSMASALLALPILGGFLFSGCGGDSGGTNIIRPNTGIPTSYTLVSPAKGATNVCRFQTFTIHFPDSANCNRTDLSSFVGVFPEGQSASLALNPAYPVMTTDGGCDYNFTANGITARVRYNWGILRSTGGLDFQANTNDFVAGSSDQITCGNSTSTFILQTSQSVPVKMRSVQGGLGTYDAATNKFNADGKSLLTLITNLGLSYLLGKAGLGNTMGASEEILLTFNLEPNLMFLQHTVFVSYLGFGSDGSIVSQRAVNGYSITPASTSAGGMYTYRIVPPASGYEPGSSLVVTVDQATIAKGGQPLTDESASGPRSYIGLIKVGQ